MPGGRPKSIAGLRNQQQSLPAISELLTTDINQFEPDQHDSEVEKEDQKDADWIPRVLRRAREHKREQ